MSDKGTIKVFTSRDFICAECGQQMIVSIKYRSDVEHSFLWAWCLTDGCSQRDKEIKIPPMEFEVV